MKFGLEQFPRDDQSTETCKGQVHEASWGQVHETSLQSIQQMQVIQTGETTPTRRNQQQDGFTQLTSQTSQHSQITRNMQIGNISVEQMAMVIRLRSGSSSGSTGRGVLCTSTHRGTGYTGTGVSLTNTVL